MPCFTEADDPVVVIADEDDWQPIVDCINSGDADDDTTIDTALFNELALSGQEWGEISTYLDEEGCSEEAQEVVIEELEILSQGSEADIENRVLNYLPECQKEIWDSLNELPNGDLKDMYALFTQTDTSNPYNIILRESILDTNELANTNPGLTNLASGGYADTTLNKFRLANASDLLIAQVLMHELVHASIVIFFNQNPPDILDYDDHTYNELITDYLSEEFDFDAASHNQFIRDNIVNKIKNALIAYGNLNGYNLSETFCENLAWAGLQETVAYGQLDPTQRQQIEEMLEAERTTSSNGDTQPIGNKACN